MFFSSYFCAELLTTVEEIISFATAIMQEAYASTSIRHNKKE